MEYFCPFCRQQTEPSNTAFCCDAMRNASPIDRWLVTRDVLESNDKLASMVARGEAKYLFPPSKT